MMAKNRRRLETMIKSRFPLLTLAEHYLTTCRTEGKTGPTIRGYTEKLGRFVRWSDGATLDDLSIYLARDYISYLQNVPKWEGHPFSKPNGDKMSAANVRN